MLWGHSWPTVTAPTRKFPWKFTHFHPLPVGKPWPRGFPTPCRALLTTQIDARYCLYYQQFWCRSSTSTNISLAFAHYIEVPQETWLASIFARVKLPIKQTKNSHMAWRLPEMMKRIEYIYAINFPVTRHEALSVIKYFCSSTFCHKPPLNNTLSITSFRRPWTTFRLLITLSWFASLWISR